MGKIIRQLILAGIIIVMLLAMATLAQAADPIPEMTGQRWALSTDRNDYGAVYITEQLGDTFYGYFDFADNYTHNLTGGKITDGEISFFKMSGDGSSQSFTGQYSIENGAEIIEGMLFDFDGSGEFRMERAIDDIDDIDGISMEKPISLIIFNNGNGDPVKSKPEFFTTFTLNEATVITGISTYHYFNKGALPGMIEIVGGEVDTTMGLWQATGSDGQGGVKNAYWNVEDIELVLPAGDYFIIDSDESTFSYNDASGGMGIAFVFGYPASQYTPPSVKGSASQIDGITTIDGGTINSSSNVSITYEGMADGDGDLIGHYAFMPNGQYDVVYSLNVNFDNEKIDYISITDTTTANTNYWYTNTHGNAYLLALYQNGTLLNPERNMPPQPFNGNTSFVLRAHDNGSIKAGGRFKVTIATDKTTYVKEFDVPADKNYSGVSFAPTSQTVTQPIALAPAQTQSGGGSIDNGAVSSKMISMPKTKFKPEDDIVVYVHNAAGILAEYAPNFADLVSVYYRYPGKEPTDYTDSYVNGSILLEATTKEHTFRPWSVGQYEMVVVYGSALGSNKPPYRVLDIIPFEISVDSTPEEKLATVSLQKTVFGKGDEILVTVNGVTESMDKAGGGLVAIVKPDATVIPSGYSDWSFHDRYVTRAEPSVKLWNPQRAGEYEIRLYNRGGATPGDILILSIPITIVDEDTMPSSPVTVGNTSTATPPVQTQTTTGAGWYFSHVEVMNEPYGPIVGDRGRTFTHEWIIEGRSIYYAYKQNWTDSGKLEAFTKQQAVWSNDPPSFIPAETEVTAFDLTNTLLDNFYSTYGTGVVVEVLINRGDKDLTVRDTVLANGGINGGFGYETLTDVIRGASTDGVTRTFAGSMPKGSYDGQWGFIRIRTQVTNSGYDTGSVVYCYKWRESGSSVAPTLAPVETAMPPLPTSVPTIAPTSIPAPVVTPVPQMQVAQNDVFPIAATLPAVRFVYPAQAGGLGWRIFRSTAPGVEGSLITDFVMIGGNIYDLNVEPLTTYYYTIKPVLTEGNPFTGAKEQLGASSAQIAVTTAYLGVG